MRIRACDEADLPRLVDLTIETFGEFYEDHVRPLLGEEVFRHQHGNWRKDYREEVPSLHDPSAGRQVAVAESDGAIVGYVGWQVGEKPRHGQITMLAVAPAHRRRQVGRRLCAHAIEAMKADGVAYVGVFTGGEDSFHAPARRLYESLGLTRIPIAGYLGKV